MSTEQKHHLKKVDRRNEYKFPWYVKEDAKAREQWRCAECGCAESDCENLEVHHVIPVYIAYNFFPQLSREVLISLDNALSLCTSCHTEVHRYIDENLEESIEEFRPIAQALMGFANMVGD